MNKFAYILLGCCLTLMSCQPLFKALVGMKNPKYLTDEQIVSIGLKYGIPESKMFKLDTAIYWKAWKGIADSVKQKDWYQPLQVKAFNSDGTSHFHLINCNIGGFPNIDWNRFATFDTYPLDIGKLNTADTALTLKHELSMLIPVQGSKSTTSANGDEIVVVYWNRMMHKQSKSLIMTVQHYEAANDSLNIAVHFVNTDNLYLDR